MTTNNLRNIQKSGTSHEVIDAIIEYLEEREVVPKVKVTKPKVEKVTKKKSAKRG